MSRIQHIVIVGAGQAGARAAQALRAADTDLQITLIGEETVPPYERPALSKAVLLGEASPDSTLVETSTYWSTQRIDLRTGVRVEAIAPHEGYVQLADGSRLQGDQFLLTTGSRVRPLPCAPTPRAGVYYLRTLDDCARLSTEMQAGRSMVIIGGGFIGLEVASSACARGMQVSVLEREATLLARALPAALADQIAQLHRAKGVTLHTHAQVSSIEPTEDGLGVSAVRLTDGTRIAAEVVVIGIGIIPNTELAEAAGAQSADGVVVDAYGRTTVSGLWAAGDVTNHPNAVLGRRVRLESWQNAQNQAITVARNMLLANPVAYAEVPWFWSDQHGVNIQVAGAWEPTAQTVWRGAPNAERALAFALVEGRVVCAVALNQGAEIRFAKKLIESKRVVSAEQLADPTLKLKELLAGPPSTSTH